MIKSLIVRYKLITDFQYLKALYRKPEETINETGHKLIEENKTDTISIYYVSF